MAALVLALGVVTIMNLQMSGALLYITASLPPEALLKVMARYLRKKGEGEIEEVTAGMLTTRLSALRRRLACLLAAVAACGAVSVTACAFLSRGALKYVVPSFAAALLNGLLPAGVLTLWIRQVRMAAEG